MACSSLDGFVTPGRTHHAMFTVMTGDGSQRWSGAASATPRAADGSRTTGACGGSSDGGPGPEGRALPAWMRAPVDDPTSIRGTRAHPPSCAVVRPLSYMVAGAASPTARMGRNVTAGPVRAHPRACTPSTIGRWRPSVTPHWRRSRNDLRRHVPTSSRGRTLSVRPTSGCGSDGHRPSSAAGPRHRVAARRRSPRRGPTSTVARVGEFGRRGLICPATPRPETPVADTSWVICGR